MREPTIGIIGTGDFAAYFVAALRKGGHQGPILLSPHNRLKAEKLAAAHSCIVSSDDTAMLEGSDWVLMAVRPEQLLDALMGLQLRPTQILLSAVAGFTVSQLRATVGDCDSVIRIMPSSYIAVVKDGLVPIYPGCAEVESVLKAAGRVLVFDSENQFELAMVGACLSGWMYSFVGALEAWFSERGLSPSQARQLVACNILGAANNALELQDVSLEAISEQIATPGTYTKFGLDHLRSNDWTRLWTEALAMVDNRLHIQRS